MKFAEMLENVATMTEGELSRLNKGLINELKSRRNRATALKRRTLAEGDRVSWTGRSGYTEGTIVRIKRKKAICSVDGQWTNWDVPLSMLTAV